MRWKISSLPKTKLQRSLAACGRITGGVDGGVYGTWKPLKPIKRDPLGFTDFDSVDKKDLVSYFMRPPGIHELYETDIKIANFSRRHKWYWCET